MNETKNFLLVFTSNFQATIEEDAGGEIIKQTIANIKPEGKGQDFIVFDPKAKESRIEDEGRSLIIPTNSKHKCYAKLDDFGSVEALRDNAGMQELNTQYAVTIMLAEDY